MVKHKSAFLCLIMLSSTGLALASELVPNWSAPTTWSAQQGQRLTSLAATPPLPFIAVTPCRVADTRGNGFTGQYGPPSIDPGTTRTMTVAGQCGVPFGVQAASLNITITNISAPGDLRVFRAGSPSLLVSTQNWTADTGTVANAAVVQLAAGGGIAIQIDGYGPVDIIVDVNGYYSSQGIVNSLNGLFGDITLQAGTDLALTSSNQTLTLAANSASTNVPNSLVRRDTTGSFGTQDVALSGNLTLPFPWSASAGTIYQGDTRFLYTLGASSQSVFLGWAAGNFMITGTANTAVGYAALLKDTGGGRNTAVGAGAMDNNTMGTFNAAVGGGALAENNVGMSNTAMGDGALVFNTQGSNNIGLGALAGANLTTGSNNVCIYDQGVAGDANTIRIGTEGTQTRAFLAGVRGVTTGMADGLAVFVDSSGQLGTVSSSADAKTEITDLGDASSALFQLRQSRSSTAMIRRVTVNTALSRRRLRR